MPQNSTISNLPEDNSVSIADYVAIVTPGLAQTRKAKLATILALANGTGAAPNYVGKYASLIALQTDIPIGTDGNYAIVAANPHNQEYIWDSDHGDWVLASASSTFPDSFIVNLPTNNTGIPNGTVVNAGDPLAPFLKAAFSKASQPTVSVTTNANSQPYNQTGINLSVSMAYTINTSGATLSNIKLERSRDNSTWAILIDASTARSPYADNGLNPTIDNRPIYYRLTITDDADGTNSNTGVVNFATYVAPSINFSIGSTTRELGDVNSTVTGTITRSSLNIPLNTYQLQYQANGTGTWINIGNPINATGSSQAINLTHNDLSLINSNSLNYRVQAVDAQQTTTSGISTISFVYKSGLGYDNNTSPSLTSLLAMGNNLLTNGKAHTITNVLTTGGTYTYYYYAAAAGDLNLCIQNGQEDILPVFDKLADISGLNSFGASITIRIYKSHAPDAFGGSSLAFS